MPKKRGNSFFLDTLRAGSTTAAPPTPTPTGKTKGARRGGCGGEMGGAASAHGRYRGYGEETEEREGGRQPDSLTGSLLKLTN